jgi:hypothetical protein
VIVPTAGSRSIATGSNAAVTTATAFPTTASVATMARITHSASTASQWHTLAGIAASSTAAIGLRSLIRGRNTGQTIGTTTTTYTWTTAAMVTTCITADTPAIALLSAST